jgi:ribosomal protein S12 methylthiotransferase accessory factor
MARSTWEALRDPPNTISFRSESLATDTFEGDIGVILDRLRSVGLTSAAVVDLTKSKYDIPVVKVIVPHLEGEHSEWMPGKRLREAVRT